MAISIKHKFQSQKEDGDDEDLVKPSDWNDEHDLTLGQDKLLGRASSGTGPVEEIDCTAAGRALLDDADAGAQRTTLGLGAAATLGKAAGSDFRAGTDDTKALTTKAAYESVAEVELTYANPLVIDFSQGTNFKVVLEGSPEIQATGLEDVAGKMGRIRFIQDNTGNREPSWDSDFEFAGGEPPTFSTDPETEDRAYYDICDGKVYIAFVEDVK